MESPCNAKEWRRYDRFALAFPDFGLGSFWESSFDASVALGSSDQFLDRLDDAQAATQTYNLV
jgi:hypothetical protein